MAAGSRGRWVTLVAFVGTLARPAAHVARDLGEATAAAVAVDACAVDGACGEAGAEGGALGLLQIGRARQGQLPPGHGPVRDFLRGLECTTHPTLCAPPFSCWDPPVTPQETDSMRDVRVAMEDGRPNYRAWCTDLSYEPVVKSCIKEPDLVKNAHLLYERMARDNYLDNEASYCFLEGHCLREDVTPNTTEQEARGMCDRKYGRDRWANLKFADNPTPGLSTGFTNRTSSSYWGMLACAMGNFQCDVIYCKEIYCKMPEFVAKYSHFLSESAQM